jgi:AP-1 complex subunit beta-1
MSQYYNSTSKKSEQQELQEELNSTNFTIKKEGLKKVIAHMTIGKDVSQHFQSVIKCLEFNDIELKKLVYLYIINYSKTKPDDAIMVVNLFRKDVLNKTSPILRALAARTMGCLRVQKINEYLIDPLKEVLNDSDPYVRKTAVFCIPKVYETSPELVEKNDLITKMVEMFEHKEGNAIVLVNLLVSLQEIQLMKYLSL